MIGPFLHEDAMRRARNLPHPRWAVLATFAVTVILTACGGASAADEPDPIFAVARAAVAKKRIEKSQLLGGSPDRNLFTDLPGDGAVLIGFELGVGMFFNDETVYAIRPIYRLPEGESASEPYGLFADKTLPNKRVVKTRVLRRVRVLADPGYAVGGITLRNGLNIDGMSVTFMRIKGRTLDPKRSYVSDWVGGRNGGQERSVNGGGAPVVGVFGNQDTDHVWSLGLIFIEGGAPAEAAPAIPPVKKPPEPVDDPPAKPADVVPPAPEIEPDAPDAHSGDAEVRPAKDQPEAAGGISWVPFVVFGIVALPIFATLFFTFGRRAHPSTSEPIDVLRAEDDDLAGAHGRPEWDYPPVQRHDLERAGKNGMATTSLVLGSIGLLAWCLPILGLPVTITGIVLGVKGLPSYKQGAAITGIVLNIVGLVLSLLNAALGAYIAVASQHGHFR